jgi:hypothetical protein
MNKEQIRAEDARSLLANPVFKGAVSRVEESLEAAALSTDPDNKDKCARIIISKQLLKAIDREINRYIQDGEIQDVLETQTQPRASQFQR